jgi:hypothetical protein
MAENKDWKPLSPLGHYYGDNWFVHRPGEGAFSPVVNRTPEEATAARRNPRRPNLETYAAALTRDEIDLSTVLEWSPFMVKDINRGDWINAMIADHKIAQHTANALLLYPSLDLHCPRCTQIHDPYHRRFSSETCSVLSHDGPKEGFAKCKYIYCYREPTHARGYCPKINLRCFNCLHRGHAERDNVCGNDINLELFEEAAGLGWVTENWFRKEGAASGFYPIVTLPQVCHINNMGGYSRLMAMEVGKAEELDDKGARLHTQWVGAESFFYASGSKNRVPRGHNGCRLLVLRRWADVGRRAPSKEN